MKKILAPIAALLLVSCNSGSADGYQFETKEYEKLSPNIQFVTLESKRALVKEYEKYNPPLQDRDLQAFATIQSDKCTIYIVDPDVSYEPEWIGHEVVHCMYGRFHPTQP
jgi:hypothetical protein